MLQNLLRVCGPFFSLKFTRPANSTGPGPFTSFTRFTTPSIATYPADTNAWNNRILTLLSLLNHEFYECFCPYFPYFPGSHYVHLYNFFLLTLCTFM
jgi:hypothetical protein